MKQIVNIDGRLHPPEDAKISVFDHGFLFGDSVYETLRTYRRRPFLLEQHMERLESSARQLYLRLPATMDELQKEIVRTVESTDNEECYIRLIVTRGRGKIGLDMNLSEKPGYVIIVNPLDPMPEPYYAHGVKIAIVSVRRNDRAALNPQIKSSNLLNNVLAYREAKEAGAFEGVLCNPAGYVSECTGSNIFMVKGSILLTPPSDAGLLHGVTRALTMQLASQEQITFREKNMTPDELLEADECFITSTTKEIMPVQQVNRTKLPVSPGPVTSILRKAYLKFVEEFLSC